MKKLILTTLVFLSLIVPPSKSFAGGMPVIDVAAIAQLIEQIRRLETMISELNTLTHYADLDHVNLAGGKFRRFLNDYKRLFDEIMSEIEGYQEGGLLGQINRLDEVYFPYHNDWENAEFTENAERANPLHRELAKQILFTRIQFKHAAKVGAKIRETLPQTQEQVNVLLDDTAQAVGIMQSIKIGNQISGEVAKSLQTLNIALTEHLQAQAAEGLEKNHKEGLKVNRSLEAIKGWGEQAPAPKKAPRNPFERF